MPNPRISPKIFYWILIFWTTILGTGEIFYAHLSFSDLKTAVTEDLYCPRIDIASCAGIPGTKINLYIFFIALALFCSLTIYVLKEKNPAGLTLRRPLTPDLIIIGVIIIFLQTFSHYCSFYDELQACNERSTQYKDSLIFRPFYSFIMNCRKYVNNEEEVAFITDMDTEQDPGMLITRIFAYHLYPIDSRQIKKSTPDYLIYLVKKTNRPENLKILISKEIFFNDENRLLILGQKSGQP